MLRKFFLIITLFQIILCYTQSSGQTQSNGGGDFEKQLKLIENSMNRFLESYDTTFTSFFFSEEEAKEFCDTLIAYSYPGIDYTFNKEIFLRSQAVKQIIQNFYGQYYRASLTQSLPIKGYHDKIHGYLILLTFSDEKFLSQGTLSILTIFFTDKLKIISLKDEN
ncbi:MAG: hypothetical protein N2Z72_05140 [Bacteroidales bacterium]|nr:hypothetical protein [Bacteroidales bacterium]